MNLRRKLPPDRSATLRAKKRTVPASVEAALRAPGRPLEPGLRARMEPRFGRDFSAVRVHTDDQAAASAQAVDALAYTVGEHMVFGAGRYRPGSSEGLRLLAHELAHVAQQGGTRSEGPLRLGEPGDPLEAEAERMAQQATDSPASAPAAALRQGAPSPQGPPVLRRQLGPLGGVLWDPKAAMITPAQLAYQDALAKLQTVEPALYKYLSATQLNGGSKTIRTATGTDASQTPPVTIQFTFNLDLKEDALPAGTEAIFDPGAPVLSGSGANRAYTAPMVMRINRAATTKDLPQKLFHEGVHMLIYMESVVPGITGSSYGKGLDSYRKYAAAHKDYATLLAELEVFIELDLMARKLNQPGAAAKDAKEIWSHMLEEKFVFDQEKAKFGTPSTNRSVALTYLVEGFKTVGVRANPADKAFISILDKATAVFDEVDRQAAAAAAPPASSSTAAPTKKP